MQRPCKLIVIDDDPILAEIVVHIARDAYPDPEDLLIDTALTADAALVAIRSVRGDQALALIVVSDFNLPPSEITGLDILAEVHRRAPRAKRVLMSGRDPEELAPLLRAAGLDAFVDKPFTFVQMRELIVSLVEELERERIVEARELAPETTLRAPELPSRASP